MDIVRLSWGYCGTKLYYLAIMNQRSLCLIFRAGYVYVCLRSSPATHAWVVLIGGFVMDQTRQHPESAVLWKAGGCSGSLLATGYTCRQT